jgi:hypothetical protein
VPHLARLAVLDNASQPGNAQALRETELAAAALGVQVHYRDVRRPEEIEGAFREAAEARDDALGGLDRARRHRRRPSGRRGHGPEPDWS